VPLETVSREAASGLKGTQIVFAPGAPGGALTVRPELAEAFARLGLTTASAFLDLPGEVVSGHPDRHVVRVELPGLGAFYLKRQHVVGWREKLRNWRASFGWVSRCAREAAVLRHLAARGLPAPPWAAFGAHTGRAFLLVQEVHGATDLRRVLSDNTLSLAQRRQLATNVARAVAAVHAAGFTTPDLTAKHVLVNRETLEITFLDWQSAASGRITDSQRADALGALHASLTGATNAERVRALRAYLVFTSPTEGEVAARLCGRRGGELRRNCDGAHPPPGSQGLANLPLKVGGEEADPRPLLARILRAAARHATRRSVRDQLSDTPAQRLVWLAGEAVCAVPEVAAVWPRPVIGPPFYGFGTDGAARVRVAGRDAVLVRGSTSAPLGRLCARLRAAPWRSPGVTIGRVLFHLQRYGVPGPRLLAFGQRLTSATGAEWFALYEPPPGVVLRAWRRTAPTVVRQKALVAVTELLAKLHDSGCVLTDAKNAFALDGPHAVIADPRAVRIVKRVSAAARRRDLRRVARLLGV
jgi:tRNA A-37 threonylcarbamoyl transferase component Bud32